MVTRLQKKFMRKSIHPSHIDGEIIAPPSKSMMLRASACALLTEDISKILNPTMCADAAAALSIIKKLGAEIKIEKKKVIIRGGINPSGETLHCGESGLCIRMFSPIASLSHQEQILSGEGSLISRPLFMIEKPLYDLGVFCRTKDGFLPIKIEGPLKGGETIIDAAVSSQFLTGLLLALPKTKKNSKLIVTNLKSIPYIEMTLKLMKDFGIDVQHQNHEIYNIKGNQEYNIGEYTVEGDWSGASFLLVAGAVNGKVKVKGLDIHSPQGDKKIIQVIKDVGAEIHTSGNVIEIKRKQLRSFTLDATEYPDLFPPLVVLAINCNGSSHIKGIERLKYKESNRAAVLQKEFNSIGADIRIVEDIMIVKGGKIDGGKIHTHNDHRIAMAAAIVALNARKKVTIENFKCVDKSYPQFFEDLVSIGGIIDE